MLNRTPLGIRNTPLFYKDNYLVIVEAQADCSFWSYFFPSELNGYKIKLKPVGGKLQVQKYIDELLQHQAKFVVAIDSDYRLLLNCLYDHQRIVETKFHSIENLLICSVDIASIIRDFSHDPEYEDHSFESQLEKFDSEAYRLMLADVFIEKNKIGKQCVGDNCFPFLIKYHVPKLSSEKINNFITNLNLSDGELNELYQTLKEFKPRYHIRGHFLFGFVLCLIRYSGYRISLVHREWA
jgi:hypothetical protein